MNDVLDRLREELGQSPRSGAAPACLPDALIEAFALRSLPPEDVGSASTHLTTCLWCLRRYASARSLLETLEPDEAEAPQPARAGKVQGPGQSERLPWLDRVRGLLAWRVPAGWALATTGLAVIALSYAIYQELPFHISLPPRPSDGPGSPVTELSQPSSAAQRTTTRIAESQKPQPHPTMPLGPSDRPGSPVTVRPQPSAAAPRTITGTVEKVEESASEGVVSHVVTIKEVGGATYVVFAWGPSAVRRGQSVQVSGVFSAVNPADPSRYAGVASQVSPITNPR